MNRLAGPIGVLAAAALAIVGCAADATEGARLAAGETLKISGKVWADYQAYVQRGRGLGPDRQGAFGVAMVGDFGVAGLYSYYYCPREYDRCLSSGSNAITDVLSTCKRESVDCLIFARNEEILVPYQIVD